MKTFLFVITVISLNSLSAFADTPWGHIKLASVDGTQIQVDYQTPPALGNTVLGADVYLNITTPPGSDCEAPTRVVISTTCGGGSFGGATVDLIPSPTASGCRFSNPQAAALTAATHAGECNQQMSVVIKANWMTDPANGTHNFNFSLPFLQN